MPEGESAMEEDPQIFLSFSNHLGSTSAVVDYADGTLVEWKTNYAYGADESEWKNPDTKYDNADESYGFTGKEEDEEVGLHYFGARYYSSYLGRWLSPDPPVVHGGGLRNLYNYCGNSPYIYVDPDGNDFGASAITIVIAAVVGAIVGTVSSGYSSDWDAGSMVLGGVIGAVSGAVTAIAGDYGGALGAALASALCSAIGTAIQGGSGRQIALSGLVAFGASIVSSYVSYGIGQGISNAVGRAIAGYVASVAVSYGAAALSRGLNGDTWDDILFSSSVGYWASYAGSAVGAEIENVSAGGGDGGGGGASSLDRLGPDGPENAKGRVAEEGNGNQLPETIVYSSENPNGKSIHFMFTYPLSDEARVEKINAQFAVMGDNIELANSKGYDVVVDFFATASDIREVFKADKTAGVFISGHAAGENTKAGTFQTADKKWLAPSSLKNGMSTSGNLKFVVLSGCATAPTQEMTMAWRRLFGNGVAFQAWKNNVYPSQKVNYLQTNPAEQYEPLGYSHGGINRFRELHHEIMSLPYGK